MQFLVSALNVSSNAGRLASATAKPAGGQEAARKDAFANPEPALIVSKLKHHTLVLNKFPVSKRHMVLFTNTFRAQSEPLSPEDFSALWTCLRAVDALAFYNCGDKSGASQPRKHMQLIPLLSIEDNIETAVRGAGAGSITAPPVEALVLRARTGPASTVPARSPFTLPEFRFAHAVCSLGSDPYALHADSAGELLCSTYRTLVAAALTGVPPVADGSPHSLSLLLTRSWMLVVPRSSGEFGGCAINSVGYAGLMLVKPSRTATPMEVLTGCAFTTL